MLTESVQVSSPRLTPDPMEAPSDPSAVAADGSNMAGMKASIKTMKFSGVEVTSSCETGVIKAAAGWLLLAHIFWRCRLWG